MESYLIFNEYFAIDNSTLKVIRFFQVAAKSIPEPKVAEEERLKVVRDQVLVNSDFSL